MAPSRSAIAPAGSVSMRRSFVTPEGVDLQLELGTAGARAGAFMLDSVIIVTILLLMTFAPGLPGAGVEGGMDLHPLAARLLRASQRLVLAVRDGRPRRHSGQAA